MMEPRDCTDSSLLKAALLAMLLAAGACTSSTPTIPIDEAPVREGRDLRDLASGLELNRSRILEAFACRKKYYEDENRPAELKQLAASMAAYQDVVAAFDGDRVAADIEQRLVDWHGAQFARTPAQFDDMFGSVTNIFACTDTHASMAALAYSYTQESARRDAEWEAKLKVQQEKKKYADVLGEAQDRYREAREEETDENDQPEKKKPRSYEERVDTDTWFLYRYRNKTKTREGLLKGLRSAARRGDPIASEVLGSWHEAGFIVAKSLAKAARYYEAAIRDEEYEAAARLGLMHIAESNDFTAARKAVERIENAVEFDYAPWAQLRYSVVLPRDHSATIAQIETAAEAGNIDAKFILAILALQGIEIEMDERRAFLLLDEIAKTGDPLALNYVAQMHEFGMGVVPDTQAAIDVYKVAVERGSEDARRRLERLEQSPADNDYFGEEDEFEDSLAHQLRIAQTPDLAALGWERTEFYAGIRAARFRGTSALLMLDSGGFMRIDDLGASWFRVPTPLGPDRLAGMEFTDDGQRGLLVDDDGQVFRTTDGGRSWTTAEQIGDANGIVTARFSRDLERGVADTGCRVIIGRVGEADWLKPDFEQYSHQACTKSFIANHENGSTWVTVEYDDFTSQAVFRHSGTDENWTPVCEVYDYAKALDLPACKSLEFTDNVRAWIDGFSWDRYYGVEDLVHYERTPADNETLSNWLLAGDVVEEDGRYWAFYYDGVVYSDDGGEWHALYRRPEHPERVLGFDASGTPNRVLGLNMIWNRESELVWTTTADPKETLRLASLRRIGKTLLGTNLVSRMAVSVDDGATWTDFTAPGFEQDSRQRLLSMRDGDVAVIGVFNEDWQWHQLYVVGEDGNGIPLDFSAVVDPKSSLECDAWCVSVSGGELVAWLPTAEGEIEVAARFELPKDVLNASNKFVHAPLAGAWVSEDLQLIFGATDKYQLFSSIDGGRSWKGGPRFHHYVDIQPMPSGDGAFVVAPLVGSPRLYRFDASGLSFLDGFRGEFYDICASDDGQILFVPSSPPMMSLDGGETFTRTPLRDMSACHITDELWWAGDEVWRRSQPAGN